MPSAMIYSRDLAPWIPAIDARRLEKAGVISGQNFLFDIDGPRSAFTSNLSNWYQFDTDEVGNVQTFRVAGRLVYAMSSGLWRINLVSGLPELFLDYTLLPSKLAWSYAQVGNLHYFSRGNIGALIWQYNPATDTLTQIVTPEVVRWMCASYGRLMCLGLTTAFWSALDDGTDFVPSTTTGAGFQVLSMLSTTAYRVDPVADGVIIATDLGLMKGEKVQANFVFRWYVLDDSIFMFSPSAAVKVPHVGMIYMDASGFHVTDGKAPVLWEPEMADYLKQTYLNGMDKTLYNCALLAFAENFNALFVSFATNDQEGLYRISYVFYIPTGKWGLFSEGHVAVVDIDAPPARIGVSGYIDLFGYFRYFTRAQFSEAPPSVDAHISEYVWRVSADVPILVYNGNVFGGATEINTWPDDPTLWVGKATGLYYKNASSLLFGYTTPEVGPNSFINLGPFRFAEQKEADETSMISTLVIGTTAATLDVMITEDWLTDVGDEDWSTGPETEEDWAPLLTLVDEFDFDLYAVDDGVNAQVQGAERLLPIESLGASFQYSPGGFSGVFHKMRLTAEDIGTSFSVKFISIAGHTTGRHF